MEAKAMTNTRKVPKEKRILVFGSNLAGRHGRGSALTAYQKYGAEYGKGVGFYGRSYAIPTKDEQLRVLPIQEIEKYVKEFIKFAKNNPDMIFRVVAVGTGLAGYANWDMAPLFKGSPDNCIFPESWKLYLK